MQFTNLLKNIRSTAKATTASIVLVLMILFLISSVVLRMSMTGAGTVLGTAAGNAVGIALGSARGLTEGRSKGLEAGEAEGLSAKDTASEIHRTMDSVGKLEVLTANVKLRNLLEVGKSYASLILIPAHVVYTADLQKAQFTVDDQQKTVDVTIPAPELNLYEVDDEVVVLAENSSASGNTDAGITAYLNSTKAIHENVSETMANYATLQTAAADAAKNQIQLLIGSICGKDYRIRVTILSEGVTP